MKRRGTARIGRKRLILAVIAGGLLGALGLGLASASLTTPTAGSTVRGDVTISENQGGRNDFGCSSSGVDGIITVFQGTSTQVFQANKGSGGSYSKVWASHGLARGSYRILSQSKDRFLGSLCSLQTNTKSDFSVTLDNLSTTTYSGATSATYQNSFTASANLKDSTSNKNIAGRTIGFSWDGGATVGSCSTDASGNCSTSLVASPLPGTHTLRAAFAEDCCWRASSKDTTFTIAKRASTTAYTGDTSALATDDATLSAHLEDTATNAALEGRTVTFTLSGNGHTLTASGATDANGDAETTLNVDVPEGNYSITASFAADTTHAGSQATSGFAVTARTTSLEYTGDTQGYGNETASLSATLTNTTDDEPLEGKTVSFSLGTQTVTATTDALGVAETTIDLTDAPGDYTVSASYAGENRYLPSSDSADFTVLKRPTSITYLGDTAGKWNDDASVSALLTDVRLGAPIEGADVTFTLGSSSATVAAGPLGVAATTLTLGDVPGAYTVTASAGDALYDDSSDSADFTIEKRATTLAYTGDTDGLWSDDATASARITDVATGDPIEGVDIALSIAGASAAAQASDANGDVSAQLALTEDPGSYTAASGFDGNDYYEPSADSAAFTINRRPTALAYDGDTSGDPGEQVTLSATLHDVASDAPLESRAVHFTLGSFASDPDPLTDAGGQAVQPVTLDQNSGAYTAAAAYAGDTYYEPSSDSAGFEIAWEATFVDDGGAGRVFLNYSTKQFMFVSGDGSDSTGVVDDPGMLVTGSLVTIAYNGPEASLIGTFDLDSGIFAAGVRTDAGLYVLAHRPALPCESDPAGCLPDPGPIPCQDDPAGCVPDPGPIPCQDDPAGCVPDPGPAPTPPPVECVPNPIGDPICP